MGKYQPLRFLNLLFTQNHPSVHFLASFADISTSWNFVLDQMATFSLEANIVFSVKRSKTIARNLNSHQARMP